MKALRAWFLENRTSPRAAFLLRTLCMVAGAFLSLLWTRWLFRTFGQEKYGLYTSFLSFLGLAAAGEFGLGGAVSLRSNQLLASGRLDDLRLLLGTARRAFLLLSILFGVFLLGLSPWLPGWLHFQSLPGAGPLPALFAVGAASIAISIYASYLANAAYGSGSVLWPILPGFLLAQLTSAAQFTLGVLHQPLWLVHAGVVSVSLLGLGVSWLLYRASHPVFAGPLPYPRQGRLLRELATTSVWSYLFALTILVYKYTDHLIINAYFGPGEVPVFQMNGKLIDLATTLVITAGAVAMPKIIAKLLDPDENVRRVGRGGSWKLARLQSLLGLAFALGYLWVNSLFVPRMFGHTLLAPLELEGALAMILLLGSNLDIYIQLTSRLNDRGLRFCALGVIVSAFINLGLSILAARAHWLAGIGWATGASQAALLLATGWYVLQRDRLASATQLFTSSFLAPVSALLLGLALLHYIPVSSPGGFATVGVAYAGILVAYILVAGPPFAEITGEFQLVLRAFGRRRA